MSNSCVKEQLVLQAVAGTNVNATLLIRAFADICPAKPSLVSVIADHWATILVAYSCGFVPWGFLVLLDFISVKWKSVHGTRRSGYLHLTGALMPMFVVIAYAFLQGFSGDFKEMMTAIAAFFLTLYHIARTAWGLVQLDAFMSWSTHVLECVSAIRGSSLTWINLDKRLKVNNEVVDNEFIGRDVSVSFDFKEWKFQVSNPELVTLRWTAAFLCSLGDSWENALENYSLASLDSPSIWYLSQTTLPIIGSLSKSSLTNVRQFLEIWYDKGVHSAAYGVCIRPFRLISENWATGNATLLRNGQHAPGVRNYEVDGEHVNLSSATMGSFKFELENIVSSFPPNGKRLHVESDVIQKNRQGMDLVQVDIVIIAKSLGPTILSSLSEESRHLKSLSNLYYTPDLPWELLCRQSNADEDEMNQLDNVHPLWRLFIVPLWREQQNKNVLQASVHVDIEVALEMGNYFDKRRENETERLMTVNVFDTASKTMENVDHLISLKYSLGCTLDAVRTFLADWIVFGESVTSKHIWKPAIHFSTFQFEVSDYISSFNFENCFSGTENYVKRRIVWECQYALHCCIASEDSPIMKSPESPCLIMLFLCAYPQLVVFWQVKEKGRVVFEITPVNRPQQVGVEVEINQSSGTAVMSILCEMKATHFEWEEWVNAAMGLMKAVGEQWERLRKENGVMELRSFDGPLQHIKSVDFCRPVLKVIAQCELFVWTGWPMFDIRICQFEMDQLMSHSEPGLDENEEPWFEFPDEYEERRRAAERKLETISGRDQFFSSI